MLSKHARASLANLSIPLRSFWRNTSQYPHCHNIRNLHATSTSTGNNAKAPLQKFIPVSDYSYPLTTKLTTLPNGLRIASEASRGHFQTIGLYIDAGSKYETDEGAGIAFVLDRLAFKVKQNSQLPPKRIYPCSWINDNIA